MIREARVFSHRVLTWLIQRNPLYLISACFTAIGARLFLVDPNDPAGDVALILVTFGVLQIYEWAVGGILILLFRADRSPEDRPLILMVAAAFWTGPLAATIEMIAHRPQLGRLIAIAASVVALGELKFICHVIRLRLTMPTQFIAAGCIILIGATAPLLKTPESASGINELYLYAAWWVFSMVVLGCLNLTRSTNLNRVAQNRPAAGRPAKHEFVFLFITLIATIVHLIGLNYAFFCHASLFYASPVVIASSVIGMAILPRSAVCYKAILLFLSLLPAIAIALAFEQFSAEVPIRLLPGLLRDPAILISFFAAAAWYLGFWRHRMNALLHAGSAALTFAVLRHTDRSFVSVADFHPPLAMLALYSTAAYLLMLAWILKSRREAVVAVLANLAATILLVGAGTPADRLILCCVVGWSGLAAVHLAYVRPRMWLRLLPILFLAAAPWSMRSARPFVYEIAGHACVLLLVLLIAGWLRRWTRYVTVSIALLAAHAAAGSAFFATQNDYAVATILTMAGFSVLVGGAMLSWHKQHLLLLTALPETPPLAAGPEPPAP